STRPATLPPVSQGHGTDRWLADAVVDALGALVSPLALDVRRPDVVAGLPEPCLTGGDPGQADRRREGPYEGPRDGADPGDDAGGGGVAAGDRKNARLPFRRPGRELPHDLGGPRAAGAFRGVQQRDAGRSLVPRPGRLGRGGGGDRPGPAGPGPQ